MAAGTRAPFSGCPQRSCFPKRGSLGQAGCMMLPPTAPTPLPAGGREQHSQVRTEAALPRAGEDRVSDLARHWPR